MTKKQFDKLSVVNKRIAVAKDVIEQVEEKKFVPESGTYVMFVNAYNEGINHTTDIQKQLKTAVQCRVCALGASVVSLCRLNGNLKANHTQDISSCAMRHFLETVFSIETVCLIENAFETSTGFYTSSAVSYTDKEKARSFGYKYNTLQKRLIAIMKNIIKNKGEFKP